MSSLTNKCVVRYVPIIFDERNNQVAECPEYRTFEEAVDEGRDQVVCHIHADGGYYYAKIECRVIPLYE